MQHVKKIQPHPQPPLRLQTVCGQTLLSRFLGMKQEREEIMAGRHSLCDKTISIMVYYL